MAMVHIVPTDVVDTEFAGTLESALVTLVQVLRCLLGLSMIVLSERVLLVLLGLTLPLEMSKRTVSVNVQGKEPVTARQVNAPATKGILA